MKDYATMDHRYLPYGFWRTGSGETVVYDRRYQPRFSWPANGPVRKDDPKRWVKDIVEQRWFYSDATSPRINRCTLNRVDDLDDLLWEAALDVRPPCQEILTTLVTYSRPAVRPLP